MIPGIDPVHGLGEIPDQIPNHYGDVGAGWRGLLERAHEAALAVDSRYSVGQVKEKFGGLRIYLDAYMGRFYATAQGFSLWEVVEPFERESYQICEWCGESGMLDTRYYWRLTLCEGCKELRAADYHGKQDDDLDED